MKGRVPAVVAAVLTACAPDADTASFIARDSAGVRIVDNISADTSRLAWEIVQPARLEIGKLDGEPWEVLHQVAFARTLPGGGIGLVNNSTAQIFLYDGNGTYIGVIGRKGLGPGEFQFITRFTLNHDSVIVVDEQYPSKVSLFDPQHRFVRSLPLSTRPELGEAEVAGFLSDTALLILGRGDRCDVAGAPEGYWWICSEPNAASYVSGLTVGIPAQLPSHLSRGVPLAFPSRSRAAARDSSIFVALLYPFELRRYSASGDLRMSARISRPPNAVTQQHIGLAQKRTDSLMARASPAQVEAMRRRSGGDLQFPTYLPTYDGILPTIDGGAWARIFTFPADSAPRWDVFDASGVFHGSIRTPPHFRPFEVGPDYLLGVGRDSLDVERVQVFTLRKPR
jgi:hypothetical protein